MEVSSVLRMNSGDGANSYARNSTLQKTVMSKVRFLLEERVKSMCAKALSENFTVADLGCASGPNSLAGVSIIIETIAGLDPENNARSPSEILVFLNDLPGNDFNSVFVSLPAFYERLKKEMGHESIGSRCFISAMPGSFHGRLFPSRSLHFVHSSNSIHWLSQVPEGLEIKGNIYMTRTTPPSAFEAYLKQFQKDFESFLRCRAQEIVPGGQMFLTFIGRKSENPWDDGSSRLAEYTSIALVEMAHEGLVEEASIDSFHFPYFAPCEKEVRDIVEREGSFSIDVLETLEMNWDPFDNEDDINSKNYEFNKSKSGQNMANLARAASEPMLTAHFGPQLSMDDLFARFARHVDEHWATEKTKYFAIITSMERN